MAVFLCPRRGKLTKTMTEMRASVTVHSMSRSILGLALRITLLHSWTTSPPTSQSLNSDWEELKAREKSPHLQCRHQLRKGTLPSVSSFCFSSVSSGSHSTKHLILLYLWLLSLFCQKLLSLTLLIPPFASVALSLFIFYPIHSLRQTATLTTISNTVIYDIMRPIFLKANKLRVAL